MFAVWRCGGVVAAIRYEHGLQCNQTCRLQEPHAGRYIPFTPPLHPLYIPFAPPLHPLYTSFTPPLPHYIWLSTFFNEVVFFGSQVCSPIQAPYRFVNVVQVDEVMLAMMGMESRVNEQGLQLRRPPVSGRRLLRRLPRRAVAGAGLRQETVVPWRAQPRRYPGLALRARRS